MALLNNMGAALQFLKRFNAITSAQAELLFTSNSRLGMMVKRQTNRDRYIAWMGWPRTKAKTKKERRKIGRRIRQMRRKEAKEIKFTVVGFKPLYAIIDDGTKLSPELEQQVNQYLERKLRERIWPTYYQGDFSAGYEVKPDA